jgi:uncharacterized protein (DUF433 family)
MQATFEPVPVPLRIEDGTIRVADTRVTLESVIETYLGGDSAEDIVEAFPSLNLADVHSVIAYYLKHREEVDAYLDQQRQRGERNRARAESRFDRDSMRAKLLARRDAKWGPATP